MPNIYKIDELKITEIFSTFILQNMKNCFYILSVNH